MGIPGLMKDLAPYAEWAILDGQQRLAESVQISAVVIDGPSLVYEVHRRQVRSIPDLRVPLAYRHINEGVVDVIQEIQRRGVVIHKIYFDGALPLWKRNTRLERLEKHRQALENFTKARVSKAPAQDARKQPSKGPALLRDSVAEEASELKALEPPFMVASAIEHLRKSAYASLIEVIPDEADAGCLVYACQHEGVALVSNDTDLVASLYASKKLVVLVLLRTLEEFEHVPDNTVLGAECLRPAEISRRLQISSLDLLAFQRYIDPNASFSMIIRRAKVPPDLPNISLLSGLFMAEHACVDAIERALPTHPCTPLDPRLSELRYQYHNSRHTVADPHCLHMYLPALFEDPGRESPWAYGSELRQLAYSLLNLIMPSKLQYSSLQEFQRRGNRVSDIKVDLLPLSDVLEVVDEDTGFLQVTHISDSSTTSVRTWQTLALDIVNKRRREEGKTAFLPAIHLSACVQAVLYSLRLLKQVTDLVNSTAPTSQFVPQPTLDRFVMMPDLAEMMDEAQKIYLPK